MSLAILEKFLLWSIILNLVCSVLVLIAVLTAKKKIYGIHSRMFGITEEEVASATYRSLTLYKTIFVFFNVIPYVVLLIIR